MKARRKNSWQSAKAGATLLEAVIGSVILGTLLVSILMARVQMQAQSHRAEARLAACRVLDDLMNKWWSDGATPPRNDSGSVPDHEDWTWRTRTRQRPDAEALHGEVVVVEVFAPNPIDSSPAAEIELLLPRNEDDGKVEH
jgi:hypothetical protein